MENLKKYIELKKLYIRLKQQLLIDYTALPLLGGQSNKFKIMSNLFNNIFTLNNEIKKEFIKNNQNNTPLIEWNNIPKLTDNLL